MLVILKLAGQWKYECIIMHHMQGMPYIKQMVIFIFPQ